ncbi:MAG: tetratricopeptide repeat protein [Spirochaetaceae bacterium]|jgi:tetratricopeptide (TPR) repeat protein|nr:tetratricopeptide repeat protein [Spirochaetaceae bacterium]
MANVTERVEKDKKINEKLVEFIQKNRKFLLAVILGIMVLFIGLIVGITVYDALQTRAIGKIEGFRERYEALGDEIAETAKEDEVRALEDELKTFASTKGSYAGALAYSLLGNIYGEKKSWAEAGEAWTNAARKSPKTYLASVALFNAAVAAEEQGNIEGAIALYTECTGYADFSDAPRAQFSIGRLEESLKNYEAAISSYQGVINNWQNSWDWVNLAQSRIIALTVLRQGGNE